MDNLWITRMNKEKINIYFEKLGSILLTAVLSALIAWLQAIVADSTETLSSTASPEVAGATGAVIRGVLEHIKRV